ncbi:MAG: PepSY-associated TM helix domain-containing protein, partial [Planctomycetaceae bacterium]
MNANSHRGPAANANAARTIAPGDHTPASPTADAVSPRASPWPDYRTLWRWHFYAGFCCLPIVIVLSISGSIYLFKPQLEAWIDRPHDEAAARVAPGLPSAQVQAALAAVTPSEFATYELPGEGHPAARVILDTEAGARRVYVEPGAPYRVLAIVEENERLMRQIFRLHGELWLGENGSHVVELAACWTIVLLLTGLVLWWPRPARLAGVVYPRLHQGQRLFWRDLHAVTGVWVSLLALFLLTTGLPWAKFWGGYFKQVRAWTGTAVARQDWSTSGERSGRDGAGGMEAGQGKPPGGASAGAKGGASGGSAGGEHHHGGGSRRARAQGPRPPVDWSELDLVVAVVRNAQLAPPVQITPPTRAGGDWSAKSNAQNRPLRAELRIRGATGEIASRQEFADRHWIDRLLGYGIAAHEGQLFGWANVVLALATAWGLVLVCVSAAVMWWRRRAPGTLGAPPISTAPHATAPLLGVVLLLSLWM